MPREPHQPAYNGVPPGTRLNGIYEIDRMIGTGGVGEVYKGHEIQTGTAVAIKMLLPEMAENETALALFRREASALHYLMHDAIVRYFVFTIEPILQRPYLAMEYVDGRSLADILEEGPLTLEALLRLIKRVASGLKAAHERGIIHRDVSPENIIIPQSDVARAKIIDFGIARSTQLGDSTIIGSGFAGKHNYVSPEQIGLFGGDITSQSDVYSLGLVLFYAITGQKLDMGGTQFQLVEKRRKVPDLGGIDARLRPLLEHMLQPDPRDRPTMADIENWVIGAGQKGLLTRKESSEPVANSQPELKRSWRRYGSIAAAVLMTIGVAGAGYRIIAFSWRDSQPDTPQTQQASPKLDYSALQPAHPVESSKDMSNNSVSKSEIEVPRSDLARRYLEQYNGGECFFIMPVALGASAAVIEGFGASTAPFDALDKSFKKSQGFEASIGIRIVTPPQCPAITFLNKVRGDAARAPKISLASVKIRPNETLSGNIENFANRVVELLLVSENGRVQNLSYLLRPGTDSLSFSIEMKLEEDNQSLRAPQLVMAVTTPRVLDSIRQSQPTPADQFFLQVLSEAQRTGTALTASARYITIQK